LNCLNLKDLGRSTIQAGLSRADPIAFQIETTGLFLKHATEMGDGLGVVQAATSTSDGNRKPPS
jgi:hypothetical protein